MRGMSIITDSFWSIRYTSPVSSLAAIFYGLAAAAPWGVGDFFAGRGAKKCGPMEMLFVTQIGGLVLMTVLFFITGPVWISSVVLVNYALRFLLLTIGFICFYRALAIGQVGVVCTISAGYSFVTALLLVMSDRETLTPIQWMSIALIILGIAFLSLTRESVRRIHLDSGVLFAFGAMIFWGVYYMFLDSILDNIGWIPTIFYRYLCTVFWLFLSFLFARRNVVTITPEVGITTDGVMIIVGELLGQFALHFGMTREATSIIVPVSSLGPLITVVLARVFLRERLSHLKIAGIAITLLGLVLFG